MFFPSLNSLIINLFTFLDGILCIGFGPIWGSLVFSTRWYCIIKIQSCSSDTSWHSKLIAWTFKVAQHCNFDFLWTQICYDYSFVIHYFLGSKWSNHWLPAWRNGPSLLFSTQVHRRFVNLRYHILGHWLSLDGFETLVLDPLGLIKTLIRALWSVLVFKIWWFQWSLFIEMQLLEVMHYHTFLHLLEGFVTWWALLESWLWTLIQRWKAFSSVLCNI